MKIRLRGRTWTLVERRMKDWGECADDARRIQIRKASKGVKKLDALLHEMLHGSFPDLSEDAVNETAEDMARVLWELGYRENRNE